MPTTEVLARLYTVSVNGSVVGGLDTLTFKSTSKKADMTTFEDAGAESHLIVTRSRTLTLKGKVQMDTATKARDEGQAECETMDKAVGDASLATIVLTHPDGSKETFQGSITMDDIGGGNDDGSSWGCTIERSGGSSYS